MSKMAAMSATKFDKYGMTYGWLGKKGFLKVDGKLLNRDEYEDFINLCMNYKDQITIEPIKGEKSKPAVAGGVAAAGGAAKVGGAAMAGGAVGAVGGMALSIVGGAAIAAAGLGFAAVEGVKTGVKVKQMREQRYRALISIFYIDALAEFLKG